VKSDYAVAFAFLGLVLIVLLIGVSSSIRTQQHSPDVMFSQFFDAVERGHVANVTIQGNEIWGATMAGEQFKTYAPNDPDLVRTSRDKGVKIEAKMTANLTRW
jgi:cell division protease FtsH